MLDDVFLCLAVQRSRVSVCDSFCFLRHGFIRAWTATHGAWPSPLISPFGDFHYFNCNGSQVGYSSTPLPPGGWVPFIACTDRMRVDQTLHLSPTADDDWDGEVSRDLQLCCSPLFFTCDATRLGHSSYLNATVGCALRLGAGVHRWNFISDLLQFRAVLAWDEFFPSWWL